VGRRSAPVSAGVLLTVAAAPAWAGPVAAAAPAQTAAPASSQAFDAWTFQCGTDAGRRLCRVYTSVTVKADNGERVLATVVSVRETPEPGRMQISARLPLTVWLPTGVKLNTPTGEEIVSLPFVACSPQGCEAGAVLSDAQLGKLRAGAEAASATYQLQTRQQVKLDFSMRGFDAALQAMTAADRAGRTDPPPTRG
jgi:invasion protein IalB